MSATKLFAVLPTFHRRAGLEIVLAGVAASARAPNHVIVVDNGSDPNTAWVLDRHRASLAITLVTPGENLGPAGAIERGLAEIFRLGDDDDRVLFLDDGDPPPAGDPIALLMAMADRLMADPTVGGVGMVGARLDTHTGRLRRVPDGELTGDVPVDYIGGGQLPIYRVAALKRAGAPDGNLFFGFDDLALGLQLRREGYFLLAPGELWLELRRAAGRLDTVVHPSLAIREETWRRFYSIRNLVHILRAAGYRRAASRIALTGIAKSLLPLPRRPRDAHPQLALSARAVRDGWSGRLGRVFEPPDRPLEP